MRNCSEFNCQDNKKTIDKFLLKTDLEEKDPFAKMERVFSPPFFSIDPTNLNIAKISRGLKAKAKEKLTVPCEDENEQ